MTSSLADKIRAFDPDRPLDRARTIPSDWYFDPEIYALECRAIFGDTWQVAGRIDQLTAPGSFITTEIAGEPILVLRASDGVLRAFFNVCRHRAARVVCEPEGIATRLRCRYHGWTYDLAGRLRGVPEFDRVADFRREDYGLVPVSIDSWGPLVWVHMNEDCKLQIANCKLKNDGSGASPGTGTLTDFLSPLPEKTATLGLERLQRVARREYEIACNWKVFVDNYLDGGYHVNTIHPGLAGALDYSQYRTEIAGNTAVQTSPLRTPEGGTTETGEVRTGAAAYYWWVFPNLMLNMYEGIMDTNLVLPLGPGRCKVIFDFYFARTDGADAERFIADSIAVADQIQHEDLEICEDVQRGLASQSYHTGRFSVKREGAGYHFHQLLARRLQAYTAIQAER